MDCDFEVSWSIEYRELYFLLMGVFKSNVQSKEGQVLLK